MNTLRTTTLTLALLGFGLAFAGTAWAGDGHKGGSNDNDRGRHEWKSGDDGADKDGDKGRERGESSRRGGNDDTVTIAIGFDEHNRDVIRRYLSDDHRKSCPPGLAKKHNGCLPPGLAKKYKVGEALPPGIDFSPLPHDLLNLLGPAPHGYQYVQVDKDVLLIGEAGKKVIDAVTLLSAVDF